jgi:ABC-type amino acid transport substrate-binding protein
VDDAAQRLESRINPVYHSVRRQDAKGLIPAPFTQNSVHPPIKVTSPFAPPLSSGWVVRKGNKLLEQHLSEAVLTLLGDGTFKPISARWFGYDVSRPSVSHPSLPR